MAQDLYVVLGVSRDADMEQIRHAYRRLARRYHPDAGGTPTERFLELQNAYETLKDAAARRAHDAELDRQRRIEIRGRSAEPTIVPQSRPATAPGQPWVPLSPPARVRPFSWSEGSGQAQPFYDVVDEFFGGYVPGLFNRGRMASHRKDLHVELILDHAEARTGGFFPLDVPVREICPRCGGIGYEGLYPCPRCDGGTVTFHRITIAVPPNISDGTAKRLSLGDIGLPEADLVVLITVR